MILFVFEGKKREPLLFETIRQLFLPKETAPFVCTYNSNIYSLYSRLKKLDVFDDIGSSGNTVTVLNEILLGKGDHTLEHVSVSDVSEIFLFFDYDFHESRLTLNENNAHLQEMLAYFDEETENGRLYINYPMVESIRYTKELPDEMYVRYTVCREQCADFKKLSNEFSYYKSFDHLLIPNDAKENADKKAAHIDAVNRHWHFLIEMNVGKANYLCTGVNDYPATKSLIAQDKIFTSQLANYVNRIPCKVSILNAFPIFLFEYLRHLP